MDVTDGLSEILVPPFALFVIMDGQRSVAFRTETWIADVSEMEMQYLRAIVESPFGRIDNPFVRFHVEDELHRILQRDVRTRVSLGWRNHNLVFLALRSHGP